MNRLTLLRHAKSSWTDDALNDHDRPLNDRGQRAAATMAQFMIQEDLVPDCILCSSATRTRETLQLLMVNWVGLGKPIPNILYLRALYHASPEAIMMQVSQWASHADHMMVIGHNPGLEALVGHLSPEVTTKPTTSSDSCFPTAALASYTLSPQAMKTSWYDWTGSDISLTHSRAPKDLV